MRNIRYYLNTDRVLIRGKLKIIEECYNEGVNCENFEKCQKFKKNGDKLFKNLKK